jgi:hypothetical protein
MRSTKNDPSNAAVIDVATQRINALKAYLPDSTEILSNGATATFAEVLAAYTASLDTRATVATKRSELKEALAARSNAERNRVAMDRALKAFVTHKFGADSAQAHAFGFPPARVPVRTVEEKQLAVERSLATREARHTMGRRQKEKVRGWRIEAVAPSTGEPPTGSGAT